MTDHDHGQEREREPERDPARERGQDPAQGYEGQDPETGGRQGDGGAGSGTGGFRTEAFRADRVSSNGPPSNGSWPTGVDGPSRPEQEHKQSHAGNGTVNHGPDDQSLDDQSLDGLDLEELALRRMLHQAVGQIQPTDAVLDHLRRAVPARRARKRHAAIGMAAAALFIGTAVPALLHVSNVTGSDADPSVMAGHSSQAEKDKGTGEDVPDGGESTSGGTSGTVESKPSSTPSGSATNPDKGGPGGGPTGSTDAMNSPLPPATCGATQLGSATGSVGDPDATGAVYGTFRVVNVSTTPCTVGGNGTVTTLAQGAADSVKVTSADHTAGDAADGLPDPSLSVGGLVLQPGAAYTVRFAWVPSETCPTTGSTDGGATGGPTESPSPTPSASPDTPATTSTGGDAGVATSPQLVTEDGTPADGSVAVSYTTEAGEPTVTATVPNACAGVVYKTGVMAETT